MLVGAEMRRFTASAIAPALFVVSVAVALIAAPNPSSASFSCSAGPTYTVRAGDGWFAIANRAEVNVDSLLDVNGAALDDVLLPGDQLCLPNGANPAADCDGSYEVRSGDSWYGIANRVGVAVSSLLQVNEAELSRVIFVGDTLCLPGGAQVTSSDAPAASSGESANAATATTPASSSSTYTVRPGDGWLIIADRVKVAAGQLLSVNNADFSTVIFPGQILKLPAGAQPLDEPTPDEPAWVELQAAPTQGPCWFHDTWLDARDGGRRHVGVDIFTVPGEYVYAVADGRLSGRYWEGASIRAGNAWYLTADNGDRFYYAHMQGFAPDLNVGSRVEAGQIIGWVGSTGNSTYPHLHFEIHPGGGEPVNPYPMVKVQGACKQGTPYTQPGGWIPD